MSTPTARFLRAVGWEVMEVTGDRVTGWHRNHPNDIALYSTAKAILLTLTGRAKRGGWNASWRLWIGAGR